MVIIHEYDELILNFNVLLSKLMIHMFESYGSCPVSIY